MMAIKQMEMVAPQLVLVNLAITVPISTLAFQAVEIAPFFNKTVLTLMEPLMSTIKSNAIASQVVTHLACQCQDGIAQ